MVRPRPPLNVAAQADVARGHTTTCSWTQNGSDRTQLSPIALAARDAMGKRRLKAIADRGYYSGSGLKACEDAGVAALVPKPMTSNVRLKVGSTKPTLSTSLATMSTNAQRVSERSAASAAKKLGCGSASTGPVPAPPVQ